MPLYAFFSGGIFEYHPADLSFVKYETYGGDPYTGIQNATAAAANTARVIKDNMFGFAEQFMGFFSLFAGFVLLIIGLILILYGVKNFLKNKEVKQQLITENIS